MAVLGKDQYLVFDIATQQCATPIADVREILLMAELSVTPGLPDVQAGILNLGGEAIPVLKLNRMLGLPDQEAGLYSHILLTRNQGRSLGFLTPSVRKIMHNSREELLPVTRETQFREHSLGMLMDGKDFITVLSLSSLVQIFEGSKSSGPKPLQSVGAASAPPLKEVS